ncbi:Uncharacterised protein [Vibrio cholerae]|nr:Uncharacterised protein [Vibrio cholerae]
MKVVFACPVAVNCCVMRPNSEPKLVSKID